MSDDKIKKETVDEEIRALVLARLSTVTPDTMKSIGDDGTFSRDELIEHVKAGDKIGKTIEEIEMMWLRSLKGGILNQLYE
ncbi:hypothetical protein HYW94_01920 [Candidatus Uhrbacteria bacterium]|nr:hypothetical protein [Candidatus Uhrbacteria bacterium]